VDVKTITERSTTAFDTLFKSYLEKGWKLYGGIRTVQAKHDIYHFATMVK